jgi:putative MATE family efflux protein
MQVGKDFTTGSIPKHLLSFAIPMLVGNLVSIGYGFINLFWVGNLLGKGAIGAVGSSLAIIFILTGIVSGITTAVSILISRYCGAKDHLKIKQVVSTAFYLTLAADLVLTVSGFILGDHLLHLLNTSPDVFHYASGFLKITFIQFFFLFLSFLFMAILKGAGDTVTPLIFSIIGIGLNMILDPLLIIGIGPFPKLGLNGAAVASLTATIIAFTIGSIYFYRHCDWRIFGFDHVSFDKQALRAIFQISFPSIMQQFLISGSAIVVTSFVNSFGTSASDAYGAVGKIDSFAIMVAMSIGAAIAALAGQNIGAGNYRRVKQIFGWGVMMTAFFTILISTLIFLCWKLIATAMGLAQNPAAFQICGTYIGIVTPSYILLALLFVSNAIIEATGNTIVTALFTLVSLWIIRVPLAYYLSHTQLGLAGIWIAISVSFGIDLLFSLVYYFSGRWAHKHKGFIWRMKRGQSYLPFFQENGKI